MSCLTKLYENVAGAHMDLTASSIDLVAVDQSTFANCSSVCGNAGLPASGGRYGANLSFTPATIVYQVAVADSSGVYAGATITNLNGDLAGDVDVVLFKLPPPTTSGATGATAALVRSAVLAHQTWTAAEKTAVFSVMHALGSLRGATNPTVTNFVRRYEEELRNRGIDPRFF